MTARHRLARPITALALGLTTAAALAGAPATVYVYDGAGNVTAAINTSTDADNCGGVGTAYDCSSNHVTPACAAAVCSGTCSAGWGDCNGNKLADGCEASLTTAANCGSCGVTCPARAHATQSCPTGSCVMACKVGWGNCNQVVGDGCETSLTSAANCGGCGMACQANQTCQGGVCGRVCPPGTSDKCGDGICRSDEQYCL